MCTAKSKSTWASSDILCAVLQIINHLQDCGKDYRALNRVYIPQDSLAANGAVTEALSASASSPELLVCLHQLAERTEDYLDAQPPLADEISGHPAGLRGRRRSDRWPTGCSRLLKQRDPLADKVHLGTRRVDCDDDRRRDQDTGSQACAARGFAAAAAGLAIMTMSGRIGRCRATCRRQLRSIWRCAFCRAAKREAMFEIYKFCRKVDDVADSPGPRDARLAELNRYRDDVARSICRASLRADERLCGAGEGIRPSP